MEDGTVSQAAYTRKLLKKCDMEECKPDSKPLFYKMVDQKKLKNNSKSKMEEFPYIEFVEKLIPCMTGTRPDIALCSRESILFTRKPNFMRIGLKSREFYNI